MEWFRFYTDTVYDRKMRRLPPAQRWLWVAVLTLARQSPKPGYLLLSERNDDETLHVTGDETPSNVAVTNEDLSDIAKVDITDIEEGMKVFQSQNMVHIEDGVYVVTHWNKRQYISDSSTERVRKHRDKTKRKGNVSVTPPETDTETETEINKRKKIYAVIQQYAPHGLSSTSLEDIVQFMDKGIELELLHIAFGIGKENAPRDLGSYVVSILRNWLNDGIITIAQYQLREVQKQTAAGGERSGGHQRNSAKAAVPLNEYRKDKPGAY